MDFGLKGKVALVGGASTGLGFACAIELAKEGCKTIIIARTEKKLLLAKEKIEKETGAKVEIFPADLSKKNEIEKLFLFVAKKFGTIHILVNNSGGPKAGSNFDLSEEEWQESFEKVLLMAKRMAEKAVPLMKKQKWGRIINITSLTVKQPRDELIMSNIFRLGVVGYSKTLSRELAKFGITVNCVAPGTFDTERAMDLLKFHAKQSGKTFEEAKKELIAQNPAKRILEPKELAALVAFLASEQASAINGTTIQVDGGQFAGII